MFDKLLEFGTVFDWISPLWAMIRDLREGPNYTFFVPYDCGWSGREIVGMLKRDGIKTWGHMIVSKEIMITVRKADVVRASRILENAGVPALNLADSKGKLTDAGVRNLHEWQQIQHDLMELQAERRRQGFTGKLTSFLSSIVDDFRL